MKLIYFLLDLDITKYKINRNPLPVISLVIFGHVNLLEVLGGVFNQLISENIILLILSITIPNEIGLGFEPGWINLQVKKLFTNEIIELFIDILFLDLVLDEVYPFWSLYLNYLI